MYSQRILAGPSPFISRCPRMVRRPVNDGHAALLATRATHKTLVRRNQSELCPLQGLPSLAIERASGSRLQACMCLAAKPSQQVDAAGELYASRNVQDKQNIC